MQIITSLMDKQHPAGSNLANHSVVVQLQLGRSFKSSPDCIYASAIYTTHK